jgi:hypothetical protein
MTVLSTFTLKKPYPTLLYSPSTGFSNVDADTTGMQSSEDPV